MKAFLGTLQSLVFGTQRPWPELHPQRPKQLKHKQPRSALRHANANLGSCRRVMAAQPRRLYMQMATQPPKLQLAEGSVTSEVTLGNAEVATSRGST